MQGITVFEECYLLKENFAYPSGNCIK